MLFNFGKCKCLHTGSGNTGMNYEMGGTILSKTVKEKEFMYPCLLFPTTGKIPDMILCSTLACFVFFSRSLYFSTIAVVPSLSALFVPTCTSRVPPFHLPMMFSTFSVTCYILAPGKHTTTSSPLLSIESVFRMIESPT